LTRKTRIDVSREIRRVIALETAALRHLNRAVNRSYAQAVRWLAQCRGKVILTGVGKSGLIAQKIAATFSSTGTPAAYLDVGEALHGSLGFIQRSDLVLAIGKSGESDELNNLLPAIRSIGARLIAVTANPKSTLARGAGLVLFTPIAEEACPLNLSPTCSTTAALALGDALAVALMKLRNFRAEHFALNHPGGRIGKRLTLRISDIMRRDESNPTVSFKDSIKHMLIEITRLQAGAVSVVNSKGRLAGLVTDYDIRRALEKGRSILSLSIPQIMNPKPTTIFSDELAARAIELMENRKNPFNVLPVINRQHRPVGMVQIHDLRARGL
jgi:arabinose-5-phosphate isomerase